MEFAPKAANRSQQASLHVRKALQQEYYSFHHFYQPFQELYRANAVRNTETDATAMDGSSWQIATAVAWTLGCPMSAAKVALRGDVG